MAGSDRTGPAGDGPDGGGIGRLLSPTRVASLFLPGVRRVAATIPTRQAEWERHHAQLAADGPLWVALGDSSVLGVGASDLGTTAAAVAHHHLCARTGQAWRLVNLGAYGVQIGRAHV